LLKNQLLEVLFLLRDLVLAPIGTRINTIYSGIVESYP